MQLRNINHLYHFTNAINLPLIFQLGLQPRSNMEELAKNGYEFSFNDEMRLDGCKNASSLSIEFPNYKMFYRIRQETECPSDWAVLKLSSDILCNCDCAFCRTNASDATVTCISIDRRKGANALLQLFDDWEGKPTRAEMGLPSNFPTNPQAEVLAFGVIPTYYIKTVFFESQDVAQKYAYLNYIKNGVVQIDMSLFCPRFDYSYWR